MNSPKVLWSRFWQSPLHPVECVALIKYDGRILENSEVLSIPLFENSVIVGLPRGVKVFLSLTAGVTRGEVPIQLEKGPSQSNVVPEPGYVIHEGVLLPPKNMRPCGPKYKDDEFYFNSARKRADILVKHFGLSTEPQSTVSSM